LGQVAEYVQQTNANGSVPPGTAIDYTTSGTVVVNTIGISTTSGPGAVGTAFELPVGTYMVDFENSNEAACSFAIYQGSSNTVMSINDETIVGSSTGTTWLHGRAYIQSTVGNQWMMVSSVVGTAAIPAAGNAVGEFIARITFLRLS
jgi:hypothetical protein